MICMLLTINSDYVHEPVNCICDGKAVCSLDTIIYEHKETLLHSFLIHNIYADRGSTVVNVLCYKSEGRRWFDSRWCHLNFSLT